MKYIGNSGDPFKSTIHMEWLVRMMLEWLTWMHSNVSILRVVPFRFRGRALWSPWFGYFLCTTIEIRWHQCTQNLTNWRLNKFPYDTKLLFYFTIIKFSGYIESIWGYIWCICTRTIHATKLHHDKASLNTP